MNANTRKNRTLEALRHALGMEITDALDDPLVKEIMVNPDGKIWVDKMGEGRIYTGKTMPRADADSTIRLLADHAGLVVTKDSPLVAATLPITGERFQGMFPPIVANPSFTIRKPAIFIFGLDSYVERGALTARQAEKLRQAITDKLNILIIGGTGSGKTTFANALLAEPAFKDDRLVIIEDNPELQCDAPDKVSMLARMIEPMILTRDLIFTSLRLRPDRIIVGEVRDGAALEMIKVMNTGHPGSICTLHANSTHDALYRLEDLIGEVSERIPFRAIGSAIDLIIDIQRTPYGGRINEIVRCLNWENGQYHLDYETYGR
ncbi:MAG: P-type conjugative transfer ATPase TrbB [Acidiphilium sp.]|nr:P-type conjugative transfer ATPase TrbB [Acidiphilium sp.]